MKIDTHRHFGGSISIKFVWKTIQDLGLKHLAESELDVKHQMMFCNDEPRTFHRFLDKFKILDEIVWTESILDDSIKDVCDSLDNENVDYCWMDFSINKYMKIGWHKYEAIKFIYDAFERYRPGGVGLILSLKYESMRASQRQYAKLIEDETVAKCLIGIDLVGDETYFDCEFYKPLFVGWNQLNKITRAHVGESQSIRNIGLAMCGLQLTNVAHGFKIVDDPEAIAWAIDNGVTFDLAISSNDITGVWSTVPHPGVKMLARKLKCTLGSDDPVQCGTTLDKEYTLAGSAGFSEADLQLMRDTAYLNTKPLLRGLS